MEYGNLAKSGGHMYCSSRDIMFSVCYVINQNHMIKGSDDYNYRSPSR